MAKPSDLPPWLRGGGARGNGARAAGARGGGSRRSLGAAALAVLVFGAGAGAGFWFAGRRAPVAVATPAPVCPQAPACAPEHPASAHAAAPSRPAPAAHHASKLVPAALKPLPERKPLDDGERTQALRAFAEKKGPELRDCLDEPDHGPPLKLGAALEIGANGSVDFVQIIGADGSTKEVRRCYATHLKRWRFPEELLRGEEKLLVNFVL
jgi:hypothetical protein